MVNAQVKFKLTLLEDGKTYQVSLIPEVTFQNPLNLTSTGQVTLKAPTKGLAVDQITNLQEDVVWEQNSLTESPAESPNHDYISVGMVGDHDPKLTLKEGKAIALFSFETLDGCQGEIRLIDNRKDIFAKVPNSANNNPGNDLTAIDIGGGMKRIYYKGNYEPFKVDCPSENLSPFSTSLEPFNSIYASVELERVKDAESYSVQARVKGTTDWLTPVDFESTKLYFYGHLDQVYEYQVKTIFKDGREDWGSISEITRVESQKEEKY